MFKHAGMWWDFMVPCAPKKKKKKKKMQQCWLKLVSHCLEPGAALENMFACVILAYLQKLGTHLGFGGYFITIFRVKIGLK
jgi:hypothetical protein